VFLYLLVEFLFRLTFGVATAMGLLPAKWVTGGFFRVHLWVLLGVQTLAALATFSSPAASEDAALRSVAQFLLAVLAAVGSYVGAVIWMYERRWLGKAAVWFVAACALGAMLAADLPVTDIPAAMQVAGQVTSGLVLGLVTTAMLLGHWYLNTPTMKLEPLKWLIVLLVVAVIVRMGLCFVGAWLEASEHLAMTDMSPRTWGLFLALRWLSGLVGVLVMAGMTWQTLKIPNTQSATGILYAGVILAFIGELTSLLLSAEAVYPV
jgi:hypothetical protein